MWAIEGIDTRQSETAYRSTGSVRQTVDGPNGVTVEGVVSSNIYSFGGGQSESYLNCTQNFKDSGGYTSMTADTNGASYYGIFDSAFDALGHAYTTSSTYVPAATGTVEVSLSTTTTATTGYVSHFYNATLYSTHVFVSSLEYVIEVNSTSSSTATSRFTTSTLRTYAGEVLSLGTESFSSSHVTDSSDPSFSSSTNLYTSTRVVASDCATGTVQATLTSSRAVNASQRIDHFLFGANEWAWAITYSRDADGLDDDDDDGVFAIDDIADEITGSSWSVPTTTTATASTGAGDQTYTYEAMGMYLEFSTWTQSFTTILISQTTDSDGNVRPASSVATGMDTNLHNGYDQLPTPGDETFLVPWTYVTTYSVSYQIATATVAGNSTSVSAELTGIEVTDETGGGDTYSYLGSSSVTTTLPPLTGFSGVSTFAVELARETTTSTAYYDASGNIVDSGGAGSGDCTTETATTDVYQTTGSMVVAGIAPLSSSSSSSAGNDLGHYSTYNTAQGGYSSTGESSIPFYCFSSYLASAVILEATFASALRFGTDGKFDKIAGPGSSCHYPFFSEVWSGLWTPMTFAGTKTATWQGSTSSTQEDDGQAGGTITFSVPLTDNPVSTLTYSWGRTGEVRGVTISAGWSTAGVGANPGATGSSTTAFTIGAVNANDSSFYSVRTFDPSLDQQFALGGKQWDDNDHIAILGRGIWQVTTNDSTGGTTTGSFKVTDSSMINVGSDTVVAFRPKPAFETVLGLSGPGDRLYVTNKWNFD